MGAQDVKRLKEIRNDKLHRLRLLEKQQAIMGFNTPPETIIEIEQTRRELEPIEYALAHPAEADALEELGTGGRWLALDRKFDLFAEKFSERMDRMEEHSEEKFQQQEQARKDGSGTYRVVIAVLAAGVLVSLIAALASIVIVVTVLLRVSA